MAALNLLLAWPDLLALPAATRRTWYTAVVALRTAPRGTAGLLTHAHPGLRHGTARGADTAPPLRRAGLPPRRAPTLPADRADRAAARCRLRQPAVGVELLFGVGLAYSSDAFAQVLHLAFGGLTALTLWALARRYYDRETAWLATALFLATPLVIVWSRVANVDLPLACFLLLALLALLRAGELRRRPPRPGAGRCWPDSSRAPRWRQNIRRSSPSLCSACCSPTTACARAGGGATPSRAAPPSGSPRWRSPRRGTSRTGWC